MLESANKVDAIGLDRWATRLVAADDVALVNARRGPDKGVGGDALHNIEHEELGRVERQRDGGAAPEPTLCDVGVHHHAVLAFLLSLGARGLPSPCLASALAFFCLDYHRLIGSLLLLLAAVFVILHGVAARSSLRLLVLLLLCLVRGKLCPARPPPQLPLLVILVVLVLVLVALPIGLLAHLVIAVIACLLVSLGRGCGCALKLPKLHGGAAL
mmetsp:Transcript_37020/g.104516  ORF Transcript_37020/g.104516 Transcript_37020/m.104516 type:complete len:214 (+) Transcript_37020:1204-1845(+)